MNLEIYAAISFAQSAVGFLSLLAVIFPLLARLALAVASSAHAGSAGVSSVEPSESACFGDFHDDAQTHDEAGALSDSAVDQDEGEVGNYFDLDASFEMSPEVDSEWLRSGDIDVRWELESIASATSSRASLNDTDILLGGESYDSSEESDEVGGLFLGGGCSSDLKSLCSSLNDSDYILGGESYDSSEESDEADNAFECTSLGDSVCILELYDSDADVDEVDCLLAEDDAVENELEEAAAVSVHTTTPNTERAARVVAMGDVNTAHRSANVNVNVNAAGAAIATTAATASIAAAAAAKVAPKVVTKALQYLQSDRYIARLNASLEIIQAAEKKSKIEAPLRFRH